MGNLFTWRILGIQNYQGVWTPPLSFLDMCTMSLYISNKMYGE